MNQTERAATEIFEILEALPSPRHAAAAVALVRATLFLRGDGTTEAEVKNMIADDDRAAIDLWRKIVSELGSPREN